MVVASSLPPWDLSVVQPRRCRDFCLCHDRGPGSRWVEETLGELDRYRLVCCRTAGGLDRALGSVSWSQLGSLDRDVGGATTFSK